jgi:hypothetical protein
MSRKWFAVALVAPLGALWGAGCGDDETLLAPDAGYFEGGPTPEAAPSPTPDGGDAAVTPGCASNAVGAPARLLLSMNNASTSELVAFNIADKKVDGRYTYPGFIGLTSSQGAVPYLLEEAKDIVAKLDPQRPWEITSSWNLAGDDRKDGGAAFAEPVAVVVPDCTKGYVLRFNRNKIGVIDTASVAEGGAPTGFIDLGPLVQPGDPDGLVEMTGAVYVPSKKRIYVLLGNVDFTKFTASYDLLCSATKPSIIAIDTVTGQLANLGGTAPGGGIALGGYNPPLGASLAYDAARDRLLVLHGGCNQDQDGGAGPIQQRRIEQVDLATGVVTTLLSLDDKDFPTGMLYIDGNRAAVTFAGHVFGQLGRAYLWDPSAAGLGAEITGGLDYAAHDGKGNLVGVRATKDGGAAGPFEIVSVPFTDAGVVDAASVTKLGENPFTDNTGLVSGAEIWPHP